MQTQVQNNSSPASAMAVKKRSFLSRRTDLDLTNGPLFSTMIRFALPLLLANLINTMFHSMDIMVLSRFAEGNEVAALGATSAVNALFSSLCVGICTGVTIILARLVGRGEAEKTRRVVSTAILTGAMLGVLMGALGMVINRPFLSWTDCPTDCMEDAVLYSNLYFAGLPFMLIYQYAASVIRVSGDSESPLRYMILAGLTNISLNALFCLFMERKVAAVAIATFLSQALGAFLSLRYLMKKQGPCHFSLRELCFDFSAFKKMLWYGLPSAITSSIFPITNLQIQAALNAFGADTLTGNVAAVQFENIVAYIGNAFASAATTFIGQNIGAKKKTRVYKSFFYAAAIETGSVVFAILVGLIFGKQIVGIFGATEGAALDAAMLRMHVVVIAAVIPLTPMPGAIQAFGYPTLQTAVQMIGTLGVRTLWMQAIYGKVVEASLFNLYLCYPITYSIVTLGYAAIVIVLLVRYKKDKLKDKI